MRFKYHSILLKQIFIGNPGSTPYNNMYQDKKPEIDESHLEVSSSPSPTFSDISTDSCGSTTPSTETVNEDEPYPNRTTEKSDNKNTCETTSSQSKTEDSGASEISAQINDNTQVNSENDVNESNENASNASILGNVGTTDGNNEENCDTVNNEEATVQRNENVVSAQYCSGPSKLSLG